jgi:Uncharacterized conserved protein
MKTSGDAGSVLEILDGDFVVCKVRDASMVRLEASYCFFARTPDEGSLVCLRGDVPEGAEKVDGGWCGLRVAGQLDFSLVGILSRLSSILAERGISIFAASTYDTDYIFVRGELLDVATSVLREHGYLIHAEGSPA